ncbi:MAG: tetratricopeptide repeat protein [Bacteroidales bacterium]|nr:tetratricopeptide repeat protein [Bacteroidales bacterium]
MGKIRIFLLLLISLVFLSNAFTQEREGGKKRKKSPASISMIDKKQATAVFLDGTKARILGDFAKATSLFEESLQMDPGNDAAMYELAQLYFERGDYALASSMIEKAMDLDGSNPYYCLLALDVYGKSGRKDDVLKICNQLVKQYPENIDYRFELASAYLMVGKADEAIKTYNYIENIMGVIEEISLQKERIYLVQGKSDKAVAEIGKLIESFPEESGRYYSMIAEVYMQDNKPDAAAEYYRKIVEADPGNPFVHISLSDYYRKKGDTARSLEELEIGFANPNLDVDTKVRILTAYYSANEIYVDKKAEVSKLSDIILTTHPKDAKALSLNADLLYNDQKYAEARVRYLQVLEADSSRYAVWESLLQTDASLSNWSSLNEVSSRAMDLFPFQPIPYFYNGVARLQQKDAAGAIKVLTSGSKLVASNDKLLLQFYTYLGDAYNQTKQYSLSDENYDKALRLNPEDSYVLNNYAYYLSLRNTSLDKALQMAKKGAELDSTNPANLDTYGWVLFMVGRFEEARTWVGKAISLSPKDDADLLEHYGDILYKLGDNAQALEYWKRAKQSGGNSDLLEKKIKDRKLTD